MSDSTVVPYQLLQKKIYDRLVLAGIASEQAQIEADIMTEADLLGVPSHGVRMLPPLLKALAEGRVTKNPQFTAVRQFGAIAVLDCNNGPGRYASQKAMQQAITLAQEFGVGVCLAKNTTHWGRAHAYANRAAQAGFIGICTTNAIPTMAIGGATKAVIGNNPLAIGIPGKISDQPIVLDMAMSQAAVGKVGTWLREGKTLPDNWGLDAEGKPTNDAKAILGGAVLPMGEHKGAGLALMFELLTAALAGTAFTHQIRGHDPSGLDPQASKIFIALNPSAFIDPAEFHQHSDAFIAYLKTEAAPFSYPGERGWQTRDKQLAGGVELHNEIVLQLNSVGIYFN
ncbi:Ldh family oxidoreductase [Cellvibrio mixtus]|uniref:Ldh family oxidoreductase n=1 Tax=Cellvibrio mixtus TaxID=39650 RepID=UPI0005875FD3|nr:Ldh family oxidoreductase [Cellvibrio mixtus]